MKKILRKQTILIFDSGIGGLSIYNSLKKILSNVNYLYIFDNAFFPYGEKTSNLIIRRVVSIINAVRKIHKFDLAIIACNTASTVVLSILRKKFPDQIIGVVPAIKTAAKLTNNGTIGLLSTQATSQCRYVDNLIKRFANRHKVIRIAINELANLAEDKFCGKKISLKKIHKLLRKWLEIIKAADIVILGCTHFSFLKKELRSILPKKILLINSNQTVINRAIWLLKNKKSNFSQNREVQNIAYYTIHSPRIEILRSKLIQYNFKILKQLVI